MPGLISRLNRFFSKKGGRNKNQRLDKDKDKGKGDGDGGTREQVLLAPDGGSSSTKHSTNKLSENLSMNNQNQYNDGDISIPTVDPDYNHVNSGNHSLSDAGGTIGTNNQSLTNFSQAASAYGTAVMMMPSSPASATGAAAFGADRYPASPPPPQQRREEMLEIYAPAGKLGIVIDTPESASTPVVHGVKDACPIRDDIRVNDMLVAVDDVDVREMNATQVSRLISRKSSQERRKLTIVRIARGSSSGGGDGVGVGVGDDGEIMESYWRRTGGLDP